ncbi:MAG: LegC family aminotransferase [Oligoflexia bacterium]|nr:LegC family aminotransferase [Oligoflexia bacterium]
MTESNNEKNLALKITSAVRDVYKTEDFIPLHAPLFIGNEKNYTLECIESTFVSSVGKFVDKVESEFAKYLGSGSSCVAVVNGTAALSTCLIAAAVNRNDEVITQNLTFVATANSILSVGAIPHFIDVEKETLSLCPKKLEDFLSNYCEIRDDGYCYNKESGNKVSACIPMHTFGLSAQIEKIANICKRYKIFLIEDAAECLGSEFKNQKLGTFGKLAAISFNGNKIITSGGGGIVVTKDPALAKKIKHITTTAKIAHPYFYDHDQQAYNYRMPNINAALALAQFENLDLFLKIKKDIHNKYQKIFQNSEVELINEMSHTSSNYWLNAIMIPQDLNIEKVLEEVNANGIMARPVWKPMTELEFLKDFPHQDVSNSIELSKRVINIPSGVSEKIYKNYL